MERSPAKALSAAVGVLILAAGTPAASRARLRNSIAVRQFSRIASVESPPSDGLSFLGVFDIGSDVIRGLAVEDAPGFRE